MNRLRPAPLSHQPLRMRLTLWYVLSLLLLLLLFGLLLYWQVQRRLMAQIDSALQLAATQTLANIEASDGRLRFQSAAGAPALGQRFTDEVAVFLLADDGEIWDRQGLTVETPALAPGDGYRTVDSGDDQWRVYGERVDGAPAGWLLVIQSLDPVSDTLFLLQLQLIWGLPLALLLAGLGGYFLASRALQPIDAITATARRIGADDLTTRLGYVGPADEIGQLAATFDDMLDRLQAAFERERRFTADAAHELRTPLAALKGRIGVTRSRPRQPAEYDETLAELEGQVDRLIRLSNDLLFVARLEQGQWPRQRQRIEIDDFVAAVIDQVRPFAEAKQIALVEEVPSGLVVEGDLDLLIRLFLNVLDNACKYTPENGRVTLSAARQGRLVRIAVQDTGPGIAAHHLPHLFDRFYRVEDDRGRRRTGDGTSGAGLGLAIAREIARAHDGALHVASPNGQGTTVTLELPALPPDTAPPSTVALPSGKDTAQK